MPEIIAKLSIDKVNDKKLKISAETAPTGAIMELLSELGVLAGLPAVSIQILPLDQKYYDEWQEGGKPSKSTGQLSLDDAPAPLPPGTGLWAIWERDPEFNEDSPTRLDGVFTTRENAVNEMERLSGINRDMRYFVDELTPGQLAEYNESRPFGVYKIDLEDFKELQPERFESEGAAQIYADSLLAGEEIRIAECVEAGIDFTRHTFAVENLLDNAPIDDFESDAEGAPDEEYSAADEVTSGPIAEESETEPIVNNCPHCGSLKVEENFKGGAAFQCKSCKKMFGPGCE
jgi:hypothetical protein